MSNSVLTSLEIRDLINRYRSELRKLQFQSERTAQTIAQLEAHLSSLTDHEEVEMTVEPLAEPQAPAPKKTRKTRGRKRGPKPGSRKSTKSASTKSTSTKSASTKKAPKAKAVKSTAGKGMQRKRKLSKWDEFVISAIRKAKKPLISSEIQSLSEKENAKTDKMTEIQLKRKLNQVLHKLANKRGELVKVPHEGKGFQYALPEWVEDGKLQSQFVR